MRFDIWKKATHEARSSSPSERCQHREKGALIRLLTPGLWRKKGMELRSSRFSYRIRWGARLVPVAYLFALVASSSLTQA